MVTTVTGKRQITIPAKIACTLGIETGTRIEWSPNADRGIVTLTVKPGRKQLLERAQAIGRKYRNKGEDTANILERMREHDDRERGAELASLAEGTPERSRHGGRMQ